ncbi:PAS-domain containing protein [Limimaricola pyoseonensis]|uniref:PAS fold n=1 Tax=Limimaricola pyoseonensis TaxID=521013 RepID=A0A1G7EKJ9_9RHOB|nr:PAS-domain containing protein [Limimaricola pyoseonensis]SDE64194.1 PAS fold [Limimaricola pyoseonensis]
MPFPPLSVLVLVLLASSASAALIVMLAAWPLRRRRAAREPKSVFLFDGTALVDASPAGRRLVEQVPGGADRDRLAQLLEYRFPGLTARLAAAQGDGEFRLPGRDGLGAIMVEHWEGLTRLTLAPGGKAPPVDRLAFEALCDELATLRSIGDCAPQLIWKQTPEGRVIWANGAYLGLVRRSAPDAVGRWPPPALFPAEDSPAEERPERRRVALVLPGAPRRRNYEITRLRRGGEEVCFALDVTELVEAEQARRNFVQTLTKTFAQLSIGLAIFDRQRKLVMFNPALLDLTGLPVAFLSSRPQIQTVLDRLRDRNMLPEPKDYASWREQLAALEAQASRGTYCETWALPGGQTYKVTGRPHPDGAVAFLFEDISAEISLTRHFRAEIDTAQAVLDSFDTAVVVFSASGTRLMHNRAYADLWGCPGEAPDGAGIAEELARWRRAAAPTPLLDRLRDFVGRFGPREAWSGQLRLTDGRGLSGHFAPLAGGMTLVKFTLDGPGRPRAAPPVEAEAADAAGTDDTGTGPAAARHG